MGTLRQFSEKDKNYFAYQARQNYLRQQMSVYGELDAVKLREQQALAREQQVVAKLDAVSTERDALALREQHAQAEKATAQAEKEAAIAEVERLKALLAQK